MSKRKHFLSVEPEIHSISKWPNQNNEISRTILRGRVQICNLNKVRPTKAPPLNTSWPPALLGALKHEQYKNQTRRPGYARPIWMILQANIAPYQTKLYHFGPFWTFQTILDKVRTILYNIRPFELLETFWYILDHFGPFWTI